MCVCVCAAYKQEQKGRKEAAADRKKKLSNNEQPKALDSSPVTSVPTVSADQPVSEQQHSFI